MAFYGILAHLLTPLGSLGYLTSKWIWNKIESDLAVCSPTPNWIPNLDCRCVASRGAGAGEGEASALFGRSVNPISTKGADYVFFLHPPGFPNLPMPCRAFLNPVPRRLNPISHGQGQLTVPRYTLLKNGQSSLKCTFFFWHVGSEKYDFIGIDMIHTSSLNSNIIWIQ